MIELLREQHIVAPDWIQVSESVSRLSKVCPCDLLMVTEKAKHNRKLSPFEFERHICIRWNERYMWYENSIQVQSIYYTGLYDMSCRRIIVNLVPLQSSCDGIRFRSNMITAPTFSFSSWGGTPVGIKLWETIQGCQMVTWFLACYSIHTFVNSLFSRHTV
jgi:hypothetical protein